jgi:ubiquinone/menaquinone biosynthesis C-methylase UbiE
LILSVLCFTSSTAATRGAFVYSVYGMLHAMAALTAFQRWWLSAWPHRLRLRRFVPRFLHACPEPFHGEVLEVGAGRGWSSRRILGTFPQVALTALDVDPDSVRVFQRLQEQYGKRLRFMRGDLLQLPFDRSSFDIVVAIGALHYVDDIPRAVRQFLRVVRPGGLIGISDENQRYLPAPLRWLFSAASSFSRKQLETILCAEGCEILRSSGLVHYYVWARKPDEHV